jgi:2-oxoglutarate dehydrogenase E1 component
MAQEKITADNLTFLNSANAEYVVHLYGEYLANPTMVDASWQKFFGGLNDTEMTLMKELAGASWTPAENRKSLHKFDHMGTGAHIGALPTAAAAKVSAGAANDTVSREDIMRATKDSIAALMLIRAYRARGHLLADLDPLQLKEKSYYAELDPAHYGLGDADHARAIYIGGVLGMDFATVPEIVAALHKTYCGTIGIEFLHLVDPDEKSWLQERIESPSAHTSFNRDEKIDILKSMNSAEIFEQFLHKKYPGTKRFGVDGGEALIPCIEQVLKTGAEHGVQDVIVGMAHRGRLNVLANVMGKPFTAIFSEFQGKSSMPDDVQGSGDVKYHLGTSSDRTFGKNSVHLSLTANPSHLEFVNPVVIGKARAKLTQKKMLDSTVAMPLLLHGDAAFAGQGVTAETLMISELPGYRVGGTVHIVINNQIGFTTMPQYGRSGPYSTDVAKMLAAPIFHVNGDDPEAVVFVAKIATEFRQKFKKDVVIDMYCYRRYGHNEGDEPAFTQPIMYKKIATQDSSRSKYEKKLIAEGVVSAE